MRIRKLYFVFLLFILNSCYNYKSVGLLQENNRTIPRYEKAKYEEYLIKENDELMYRVITLDEKMRNLLGSDQTTSSISTNNYYRVYLDGTIDLPFVKKILVKGLSLNQARLEIERRLREVVPDAVVKLSLANKTFTVIGEAGTGVHRLPYDQTTIYQALSISGNIDNTADFRKIKIIRTQNDSTQILDFDIRPISVIDSKFYYVYPNDIIYVQRASSSFYKVNSWSGFTSLVSSSLSLLVTVFYLGEN